MSRTPLQLLVILVAGCVIACSDDRSAAVADRFLPAGSPAPEAAPATAVPITETATPGSARASPTAVVAAGVLALINESIEELDPAEVFRDAWAGATAALRTSGVTEVPPPPDFAHSTVEAAQQHRQAFPALERLATGRLGPQEITTAALREATARRHDCHTRYFSAKEAPLIRATVAGQQPPEVGISIGRSAPPHILAVSAGSPADRAGLRRGQRILAINGQAVDALTSVEARATLREQGQASITFRLQGPDGHVSEVAVTPVTLPLVMHEVLPGDVGLVRFDVFPAGRQLQEQLRAVLHDFEAQGMRGWVLDLRYNGGGQPPMAIAGLFTEHPRVAATQGRHAADPTWLGTQGSPLPVQRPLAVLIGPATASSAEALAGFLQGIGRATLVGETTAGCLGAGRLFDLADGSLIGVHAQAVLIGPDGKRLTGVGIVPDVPVPDTLQPGGDPVLDAALRVLDEQ